MAGKKLNLDQLKAMQAAFREWTHLELNMTSKKSKLYKVITAASLSTKLYDDPKRLEMLVEELNTIIDAVAASGAARGKLMSESTMERFLAESERRDLRDSMLIKINRANNKAALNRAELYMLETKKEFDALKNDIAIFKKQAQIAGMSEKQTLKELVRIATDKQGPVESFATRMEKLQATVLRREEQRAEVDEYRKAALPGEKWQWVAISVNPCPDCRIRAGVVLDYDQWVDKGLPGDGRTICRANCMCKIYPVSVSDGLFGDVKEFKWDKGSGVLTTASQERTFGAKTNKKAA